mgnify:FL=1
MSHDEIGRALGLSRQRVEQIERHALNKLRRRLGSSYRGPWRIYDSEGISDAALSTINSKKRPVHGATR